MTDRINLANGLPVTYDLFDYILERLNKLQQAADRDANQAKVRVRGLTSVDNDVVILVKNFQFQAKAAKDFVRINFEGVRFTSKPVVTVTIADKDVDTKKGPQAFVTISDVTKSGFTAHTYYSGKSTGNIPISMNYVAIGNVQRSST